MAIGIKVWNADGTPQFDITTRLLRVLQSDFSTTSGSGATSVPNQGQVVAAMDANNGASGDPGEITVSGGNVSWTAGRSQVGSILVF